jgi:hypothetical protein
MKNMLSFKDIVESTLILTFLKINLKVDMVDFVNPHNVVAKKSTLNFFSKYMK